MCVANVNNYCLKWGTRYSADYVNYLQYQLDDDLICITDDPTGVDCETMELPNVSTLWWNKMILFNEEFIKTPGVFYDLDVYIRNKVNWYQPEEYMKFLYTDWVDLKQLRRDTVDKMTMYCSINSSILCWDNNTRRQHIWDFYIQQRDKIEFSFSGIDTFIEHRFAQDYCLYGSGNVSSFYKNGSVGDVVLFEGAKC